MYNIHAPLGRRVEGRGGSSGGRRRRRRRVVWGGGREVPSQASGGRRVEPIFLGASQGRWGSRGPSTQQYCPRKLRASIENGL